MILVKIKFDISSVIAIRRILKLLDVIIDHQIRLNHRKKKNKSLALDPILTKCTCLLKLKLGVLNLKIITKRMN
jgi:hypothetical protein